MPTDPTYEAESLHTAESREREARLVGHEPKVTERVDQETVEDIIYTLNSLQFFDQVYSDDLSKAAKTLRSLLAERDALENEVLTLSNGGIVEVAARNQNVMDVLKELEDRANKAETENQRLRDALAEQSMSCTCHEAYTSRYMQDPECPAGEYGDDCRAAIGLPPLCQHNIRLAGQEIEFDIGAMDTYDMEATNDQ